MNQGNHEGDGGEQRMQEGEVKASIKDEETEDPNGRRQEKLRNTQTRKK